MTEFRPGRFQILPSVVKNLIIINVLMVVLQTVLFSSFHHFNLQDYLALHYWRSDLFRPWQLVTHLFMHGSPDPAAFQETVLHIFSNMFALWMFGSVLENIWGPKRFLTFYFICGIGAALCHLGVLSLQYEPIIKAFQAYQHDATLDHFIQFVNEYKVPGLDEFVSGWSTNPGSIPMLNEGNHYLHSWIYGGTGPVIDKTQIIYTGIFNEATVGASGAVFGVLFAFGYLFPNTLLYLFFAVPIKAKWAVAGYMVFELYSGIRNTAGDNIAHFAHLGGALTAFIILKIWNRTTRDRFF